jgi:hypothetical protein
LSVAPVFVFMPVDTCVMIALKPARASVPNVSMRNALFFAAVILSRPGIMSPTTSRNGRKLPAESTADTPSFLSAVCTRGSAMRSIDVDTAVDARSTPGTMFFTSPSVTSVSSRLCSSVPAPRAAVPRASGRSRAASANTLTDASIWSTAISAPSTEIPNAFIAWDARPAASDGVSCPSEPAARLRVGFRRLKLSSTPKPAAARSLSASAACVGSNCVAIPASIAAALSRVIWSAVAPEIARSDASASWNGPAACVASANGAAMMPMPMPAVAAPAASCPSAWSTSAVLFSTRAPPRPIDRSVRSNSSRMPRSPGVAVFLPSRRSNPSPPTWFTATAGYPTGDGRRLPAEVVRTWLSK